MLHRLLEVAFLYQSEVLHPVLQAVQDWRRQLIPVLEQQVLILHQQAQTHQVGELPMPPGIFGNASITVRQVRLMVHHLHLRTAYNQWSPMQLIRPSDKY